MGADSPPHGWGGEVIVTVKLYANLPSRLSDGHRPPLRPGEALKLEVPEGATVGALLAQLGLPREEVKVTFVNGRAVQENHPLRHGDEVGVFPPIGGG
ncbi:MAG: MoaD/ThiS family protein [Chloroflexi bacterium]|nr:MoaD/ThiS family protein [Chloroflexota bacterium]